MNTRRTPTKRFEENDVNEEISRHVEKVPQVSHGAQSAQGDQVPIRGQGNKVPLVSPEMTNAKIKKSLLTLD